MTEEIIIEQNMLKTLLICLKDFTNVQEAINASNIICNLLSLNSEVSIALCNE